MKRAFFSLVRIPTVFSSMSNAYAGWWIGGGRGLEWPLWAGVASAALFIMAGMALNDVADKDVDARERPNRPIPSGAISLRAAWTLSLGMMALGLAILAVAHPLSALFGLALCAAIFAYNFWLKGGPFGPAAMGLCRALNLFTGMSLAWSAFPAVWPGSVVLSLISLWAYIALVTYLARDEVGGNSRRRATLFLGGQGSWFAAWAAAGILWYRAERPLALAWLALAILLRDPLRDLAKDPSPKHTGKAVGMLLRCVPLVDVVALFANQVPWQYAAAGALWILPAYAVGKWFYST
ncbi:MAG: UbiA family prenyltransferase [Fibrobacteres bacterium]|nr:UbiA family prenyltransferase [Fibrobacterota bacterium]